MSLLQGGVERLLGEPRTCPVCGVPNCVGHPLNTATALGKVQFEEWAPDARTEEAFVANDPITVTERVWEERPAAGRSKRTTRVLVAAPGQTIDAETAKRLNVGSNGRQSSVPKADRGAGNIFDATAPAGPLGESKTPPVPKNATTEGPHGYQPSVGKAGIKGATKTASTKKAAPKKAAARKATKAAKKASPAPGTPQA